MNSKQKFEENDERNKIIGQNGNDGLVYESQHYADKKVNGLDVIDLIKHWNLNFNEGNILKYLLRDKDNRIKDLTKIVDYAKREIKYLENQNK